MPSGVSGESKSDADEGLDSLENTGSFFNEPAHKEQWWRGLLARVTIAYALGSLVLSVAIAYFAFTIAQDRLTDDFNETAQIQFYDNAISVREGFEKLDNNTDPQARTDLNESLSNSLKSTNGSRSILIAEDRPPRLSNLTYKDLPDALQKEVAENKAAVIYAEKDSEKRYIIGIRMEDLDVDYYEVFPLDNLDTTLAALRRILIGTAMISAVAGATLGYYAARRALSPITRVSLAAQAIAEGDFQTRLDPEADPDLAILSSSFNEMVDALRARVERDERFTSDVSHELRSPLMTLTASIEVLERHNQSFPEPAQQAVVLLGQDLKRFQNLVEDLLEISRMDAGAVQLQLSQFDLAEFLTNVVRQSGTPEIELRYSNRDRDLNITADKRRLAQVLTNLITNADKYAGGVTSISFRQVGYSVQIAVEDEGEGIAPEERKQIFERFSRGGSEAGKRASGTGVGLGLSLVVEHVRLHSGRVWVTDRMDDKQGSRFIVELPIGEHFENDEEMAL